MRSCKRTVPWLRFGLAATLLAPFFGAQSASAFFSATWDYLRQYQLGVDYTSSYDGVEASYEMDAAGSPAEGCVLDEQNSSVQRCSVRMSGGASSGFGLILQHAFKRQGTFYFKPDIGFGARYLAGELGEEEAAASAAAALPLRQTSFALAALVVRPYVTLGITPASRWPDLLISLGPSAQIAVGEVTVNDETESVAVATSSRGLFGGYFELELVLWRFGDGALSLFHASDFSGDGRGTDFYPKDKDGMRDFRANFARSVSGGFFGLGVKLLLNWP